ncbi:MAG: LysM peptidoglycan-binding domain-containing protein [Candidatus Riflebacteria bacterium]|nr:LysM peptidoglycan-binding domain-containing protein [Candidatus Riflebacteria bacterium]
MSRMYLTIVIAAGLFMLPIDAYAGRTVSDNDSVTNIRWVPTSTGNTTTGSPIEPIMPGDNMPPLPPLNPAGIINNDTQSKPTIVQPLPVNTVPTTPDNTAAPILPLPPTQAATNKVDTQTDTSTAAQAPAEKPTKEIIYTVVKGDTLSAIAQKFLGAWNKWPEIVALNKHQYPTLANNPDLIHIGWKLKIVIPDTSASSPGTSAQTGSAAATGTGSGSVTGTNTAAGTETQAGTGTSTGQTATTDTTVAANTSTGATSGTGTSASTSTGAASGTGTSAATGTGTSVEGRVLTVQEKQQKLQIAVNQMNRNLAQFNRRLTTFDEKAVTDMIAAGILTHEDWLALNPPEGYRWVLKGTVMTLEKGTATAPAPTVPAATQTNTSTTTGTQAPVTPTPTPTPVAPTEPPPAAPAPAQQTFQSLLGSMQLPDLLAGGRSKYNQAFDAALPMEPQKLLLEFYENSGQSNLFELQEKILAAQIKYEEAVNKARANPTKWVTENKPAIEAATKEVEQYTNQLRIAWTKFVPVYRSLKASVDSVERTNNEKYVQTRNIQRTIDGLRLQPTPENMAQIATLTQQKNALEAEMAKDSSKAQQFQLLKALFPAL